MNRKPVALQFDETNEQPQHDIKSRECEKKVLVNSLPSEPFQAPAENGGELLFFHKPSEGKFAALPLPSWEARCHIPHEGSLQRLLQDTYHDIINVRIVK